MSLEFIPGRRYIVSTQSAGLIVGTFVRKNRLTITLTDVVQLFESCEYVGEEDFSKRYIIDAEEWNQSIALVDVTNTDMAREVARQIKLRKAVSIARADGRSK
jgi:hypothetical protein